MSGTLTTAEAAVLAGMPPGSFRGAMTRERARGRDYRAPRELWPDGRTPLWNAAAVNAWAEKRRRRQT